MLTCAQIMTTSDTGTETFLKEYDEIANNFFIGNYYGQEAVDNDDGSAYVRPKSPLATENLLENTNGVLYQCSLGVVACYLLFMLTAGGSSDDVIAF